jgi:carboxyl-terminal processing protease
MDMGEKEEDFALPFDEIVKANYKVMMQNAPAYTSAKAKAEKRIANNAHFNHVLDYAKWLKDNDNKTEAPLNYQDFKEKQEKYQEELEAFDLDNKENKDSISVNFLAAKPDWFETDTAKVEQYERWHKSLSKDVYLVETVKIIYDLESEIALAEPNEDK